MSFTSTKLTRDQGHIHLFVNGNLMSMVFKSSRELDLPPGDYRLTAEFVAVDHAPFNPRVLAHTTFRVER